MNHKYVLVTGGAGYIGSHTVIALINAGFEPIIVDNFCNSDRWICKQLEELTGKKILCYNTDCKNSSELENIFSKYSIEAIIHFAALKAVGKSVEEPINYYQNNISSLLTVLSMMEKYNVSKLVFSSSCTVYGKAEFLPVTENHPIKIATSPYGFTKQVCERLIEDCLKANKISLATILRYFNPIGAHPSGKIGELPIGTPNNLIPFICQTAAGIREKITVFGDNYNTPDGTCIRDYIHVMDLAEAHVKSILKMEEKNKSLTLNLGTGKGISVLEAIKTFEKVNQIKLNYTIGERRAGDIEQIYADTTLAEQMLEWKTKRSIDEAMEDVWRWQKFLKSKKVP